jgi:hypothetical protein
MMTEQETRREIVRFQGELSNAQAREAEAKVGTIERAEAKQEAVEIGR